MKIVAVLGIVLATYSLYVEHKKSVDPDYEALCDVGWASCSKVFTSEYGSLMAFLVGKDSPLAQPNAFFGLLYYKAMFIADLSPLSAFRTIQLLALFASILGVAASVYLGYILFFVLNDICLVCTATYVLNAILFIQSVRRLTPKQKDD